MTATAVQTQQSAQARRQSNQGGGDGYATADRLEYGRQARRLTAKAFVGDPDKTPYVRRLQAMRAVRRPMEATWREVRDYLLPACGRYLDDNTDPNNEDYTVSFAKILDGSPTKMALTAADGLHGGLTNQAEQWFSLYVGNYDSYEDTYSEEAKEWVTNVQEWERDTLASSNFYTAIYQFYLEAIGFGTALMIILRDDEAPGVRYYTKTIGSYWLSQDSTQRIDAAYIKYTCRAVDIVSDYGKENCPDRVIQAVDAKAGDRKFTVIQCIQPWNYFGRDNGRTDYRYEDVRFVEGGTDDEKLLFRGGYRTKPFVAVRWSDTGDSVYGRTCPGIEALPDVKQLQALVLDYNKAVKWRSDPAFVKTSGSNVQSVSPGEIIEVEGDPRAVSLQPIVTPDFDINANLQAAQFIRDRISATLYNREILLVQSRQRQITATEVTQLVQEKNAVLGPITARMGDNALIPILDRTFEIGTQELHVIQFPPEEIQGRQIKPYFTGQLAKAQRQGGVLQQIDYTLQIEGTLAQLQSPDVAYFDNGAMLRAADEIDMFLPGTIRTRQKVEEMQQAQMQAQAQQQQMLQMQQAADIAKTAGGASVAPDTLLGQMAGAGQEEGAA